MRPNVDPMQFLQMIRNGNNPQQLMISFLENSAQNSPVGANLLNLAKNDRGAEIERVARNICAQRGVDYDQAFNAFKSNLGIR